METSPTAPRTHRFELEEVENFLSDIDAESTTVSTYRHALLAFAEFLSEDKEIDVPLNRLQNDSLAKFRLWLTEATPRGHTAERRRRLHYTKRTISLYLAAATRFAEWLDASNKLPKDLSSSKMRLLLKKAHGRRRSHYKPQPTQEAVPLIVKYYDETPLPSGEAGPDLRRKLTLLRNRAMVHVLFATAMRAHELASLTRGVIANGDASQFTIDGKGDKPRVVKLSEEAQTAIRAYLSARDRDYLTEADKAVDDPLFVAHNRKTLTLVAVTGKTVWQVVMDAVKGLKKQGYKLSDTVSPHDFRRYLATYMLSQGMPLESVQEFLGHSSPQTTRQVYAMTWSEVMDEQVKEYRPTLSQAAGRAEDKVPKVVKMEMRRRGVRGLKRRKKK